MSRDRSTSTRVAIDELQARLEFAKNWLKPAIEIARRRYLSGPLDLNLLVAQMNRDWPAYLDRWDIRRIEYAWPAFASETRRILTKGLERLKLENAIIYPLALDHGTIRIREPA